MQFSQEPSFSPTDSNHLQGTSYGSQAMSAPVASTSQVPLGPPTQATPPASAAGVKKRARGSASSAAGSIGGAQKSQGAAAGKGKAVAADEDDEDGPGGNKKKRLALSCRECRRRKISCDRKQPCSACIRRKVPHNCHWEDDEDPTQASSFALNSDVRQLARRLAHLESLFEASNPGLLPKDAPVPRIAGPSSKPSPASLSADFKSPASPYQQDIPANGDPVKQEDSASDTEDAAATLEDVAFGARVPVLRALSGTANPPEGPKRTVNPARTGMEHTGALTSILAEPLSYDQDGRPRSAVRLGLDLAISTQDLPNARSGAMAQIFAVLPGKEITDFLINKYFAEMEWDYRVLDPEAFPLEHERYTEMLAEGREDSIDPLFVAVLCMVLALSLEGFWSRPGGAKDLSLFRGLSEADMRDLPAVWHDGALRALQLAEWGGTPRIRTIQTIILFVQYIQLSSPSGQQGRVLGWVASAIRVAQRMGLHRLGSNPETMPPDDPALPPGKNSLKREMCIRLFHSLVNIDSLLSDSPVFRCYLLHPSQYNTARPLNLNFHDLSRTEWRTPQPAPTNVYTDASFEIAQCAGAEATRRALDTLVLSTEPFSYAKVLEQDKEFRQVLEDLPEVFSDRSPPHALVRLRYQRALLYGDIYARLVRLHRPFLSRGYNTGSPFRYSREQCVQAARSIIESNYEMLAFTTSHWWMFTGSMRSAIVLFMDLFHAIDEDRPHGEVNEKRKVLVKASIIFGTEVAIPALQAVVEQGRRILGGLFSAEESRRMARAAQTLAPSDGSVPALESFAQVLKRVSHEVSIEDQKALLPATPAPNAFPPPPSTEYSPYLSAPGGSVSLNFASSAAQGLSPYDYWGAGANLAGGPSPGGPFLPGGGASFGQDLNTTFFETLAS
ncbi:hypothetical protein BCR35DRAFT_302998, partial [Leucosporidium creatinivorum]